MNGTNFIDGLTVLFRILYFTFNINKLGISSGFVIINLNFIFVL